MSFLPRPALRRAAWLALCMAGPVPAAAADPPYGPAVAARFAAPAQVADTPGLQPGRETFTTNAELHDALQALARRPGGPRWLTAGRSQRDAAIEALHFSRGPGRPVVLLVGQQHGDEPAGAEALLALARQLAAGDDAGVLDRLDVVLLPRANPDGSAGGSRYGSDGLDINRDHLWLRTPEAGAIAQLLRDFKPVVVVDSHEHAAVGDFVDKFDALPRADLLLQYATTANVPAAIGRASDELFRQPLLQALAQAGLSADWYHTAGSAAGDLRLAMGGVQPDTLRNVQGLRNGVGILLESRGLGLGRLDLARRVFAHGVALNSILRSAAGHAAELVALQARARAEVVAAACRDAAVVLAAPTPTRRDLLMLDPRTGADKVVTVAWLSALDLRPLISRRRPCGYWLAPDAGDAVRRLQAWGVQLTRLEAPTELAAETWHEATRLAVDGPARRADAGLRLVQVTTQAQTLTAPAGSWRVPLDQPLANLVFAALEPDTPHSWYARGILPTLASAARWVAPPLPLTPPLPVPPPAPLPPPVPAPPSAAKPHPGPQPAPP